MKHKNLHLLICIGMATLLLLPQDLIASEVSDYGGKAIKEIGTKVQNLVTNVLVPYVGGLFGGIHTIKSLMANNYQAMGVYALITVSSFFIPELIKGTFGTSILIP